MNKRCRLVFLITVLLLVGGSDCKSRQRRAVEHKIQKKFGFFGGIAQMGRLAYDQYTDTTKTLQKILDLLNDSFSDTATKAPRNKLPSSTTEAPDPDSEPETTTEPYKISRQELGKILNRNFRGLQKLLRLEINDALNQTKYNVADYKKEYSESIKKSKESLTTTPSSDSER